MLEADYISHSYAAGHRHPGGCSAPCPRSFATRTRTVAGRIYTGGPSNINTAVKSYFALKLMGYKPDHPVLERAREWILAMGGVTGVQYFHQDLSVRAGAVRLGRGARRSAGDRAVSELVLLQHLRDFVVVARDPGSAVDRYAKKPFKKIPAEMGIDELFVGGRRSAPAPAVGDKKLVSLAQLLPGDGPHDALFASASIFVRCVRLALKSAEEWMLERFEKSTDWARSSGILNSIMALRCLGYSLTIRR